MPVASVGQTVNCGHEPNIGTTEQENKFKAEARGKLDFITRLFSSAEVDTTVENWTKETRQQYNNLDQQELRRYSQWVSCQNIMTSKLSTKERQELWNKVDAAFKNTPVQAVRDRSSAKWIYINSASITYVDVGWVESGETLMFEATGLWSPRPGYSCLGAVNGVMVEIQEVNRALRHQAYSGPFTIQGPAKVLAVGYEAITGGMSADNGPCPNTSDQLRVALYDPPPQ